jgi:hypothetical protein
MRILNYHNLDRQPHLHSYVELGSHSSLPFVAQNILYTDSNHYDHYKLSSAMSINNSPHDDDDDDDGGGV